MLPEPLHPAVVHFPLVLMLLLPLFVIGAIWVVRRGTRPARAWSVPLALSALLVISAYVALQTGGAEEDRVESVVAERFIHEHEEAAERFLVLSGIVLVIAAVGLARGNIGTAARVLTLVGSLGLIGAGVQVGAAGGNLVYKHNAASAYAQAGQPGGSAVESERAED